LAILFNPADTIITIPYYSSIIKEQLRVRRLIAAGIVTKFTVSVDNNLLGYDHLAFMQLNTKPGFTD
jgi:hypothetical protein